MPTSEIARLASPRTTSADPVASGATVITSGQARIWAAIDCH